MEMKHKLIDLFSGIGGLSIGFKKAGFQPLLGIDNERNIAKAYENNLRVPCILADIQNIDGADILREIGHKTKKIDIIVGGPPCQGFSIANRKRILADSRNRLFVQFIKIVEEVRPTVVLIENVPGLKSDPVSLEISEEFHKIGYKIGFDVLNAANFGVPQFRERFFIVGTRTRKHFEFPKGEFTSKEKLEEQKIEMEEQGMLPLGVEKHSYKYEYVTVWETISDLPPLNRGQKADKYYKGSMTRYQKERRNKQEVLLNHVATPHSDAAYERIRLIQQGENWKNLPIHLQTKSCHSGAYGRLKADEPATTITTRIDTPTTGRVIHPFDHRTITIREGARLQSFDDSVDFYGTRTSMGKQLGNAVPPLLAKALAVEISKQLLKGGE